MSSLSSWAYTATATLWKRQSRDDWAGSVVYAAPVQFLCDYSAKAERRTDVRGSEFISSLVIYTERADVAPGDRVALGTHTPLADPLAAAAVEVRAVQRSADTFDRAADDFELVC